MYQYTEFDKAFDEGQDIIPYLDPNKACRIRQQYKKVNVDFTVWMIDLLDKEA
jgi:hypothetical protein